MSTKILDMQGNKPDRVRQDNKLLVFLLKLMAIEARGLFHATISDINEWYYHAWKGKAFKDSTFGIKEGRDPDAYKKTDNFRTTLRNDVEKGYTEEFLGNICRTLRVFGPLPTWQDFANHYQAYLNAAIERLNNKPIAFNPYETWKKGDLGDDYTIWLVAESFYLHAISKGITLPLNDDVPLLAASSHRFIIPAIHSRVNTFPIMDAIETSEGLYPKVIHVDRVELGKKNLFAMCLGLDRDFNVADSITIVALNKYGHNCLIEGKLFHQSIPTEMLCGIAEREAVDCIYIDCGTALSNQDILPDFTDSLVILVTNLFGESDLTLLKKQLYILCDTMNKREIVGRYKFNSTDQYAIRKIKNGKDRAERKYYLYSFILGELDTI